MGCFWLHQHSANNFYLFLYMKSIAYHIYHTSLKTPLMIFCIPRNDVLYSIMNLIISGYSKAGFHFYRWPEKTSGLLMLHEMFVSLFHCLESSRNTQPSISNMKLQTSLHYTRTAFFYNKAALFNWSFWQHFSIFVATTKNSSRNL